MRCFSFALTVALVPLILQAGDIPPVDAPKEVADSPVGRNIADFTLRDYHGKQLSLGEIESKVVVVAILGIDCPLVRLYGPRLEEMSKAYDAKDVTFIGINANKQDPPRRIGAFVERFGITFPILKDPDNSVADKFGAIRTPEMFVLDENRVVRYWGRVDDQYGFTTGVGYARPKPNRHDLKEAVDELLAGKPVSVAVTEAQGCHIGRVAKVAPHGEVTYSNQISRIFNARCVECHREGQIGPFPMTCYDEVHGWGEMIREVVDETRMPPWHANPEHGKFANDCRLSADEKNLIARWVENGQPEGDPADLPEPPTFTAGWTIPEPDQIFYMNEDGFEVAADGVIDYQYFEVETGFTEDKWVKAVQARPGNLGVVHHIIAFVSKPSGKEGRFRLGGALIGYAPGTQARVYEDGHALHIPAGSKLVFQMHYTPVGTKQMDRSSVGMVFVDESEVTHEIRGGVCGTQDFVIPAGAANHVVKARRRIRRDTTMLAMLPHLHVRGIAFKYEAMYPDGTQEVLLDVPHYDFNWQLWYTFDEPKLLPRGTVLNCTAVYDNSEDNVYNPDHTIEVKYGEQTWEEMMFGWYSTSVPREEAANIPEEPGESL